MFTLYAKIEVVLVSALFFDVNNYLMNIILS